ncbi:tRNA pseudouridine(38-40) synthase TruA [Lentilactobacillus hilgardii]|uniref:tRNA pseudouridine synthase A n=2 Tax=Lentilactobacillus hilgardii TaxID=1588 RepID=A0A6P1E7W2_LENHI|nr:tRNA pseudouridine(38-40) synthase TruA [Lentilactobacillus hilgardii]RRG10274.1 MAG: tRNA pseudouridine(38-40) synthase TruA [Lactobacillus sp.]MBZ2205066.1 tRNA pseudouridine(38-40) synthase TruA [Lentilactobacillus hilgardii]MCT3391530.1 tRNA pseudouridine(38-40) synthase TruA [Lentilactobacillus hilgardii]MCT3399814.1 tRNA pseudouridine(38-40) synthase TruA [Lentilactobacillus hilgardii]
MITSRYKITFMYDGTNFSGFERQPNRRTIEGVLTQKVNVMAKMPEPPIIIYGSGRTDAGVHAVAQVAHFDFPFDLSTEAIYRGLNSMLPLDMEITKVEKVSNDFHARYDVSGKKYFYRMYLGEFQNPFKRNYTGHWKFPIDMEKVNHALADLVGEHDFSSFVASGSTARSNIRTIYSASAKLDQAENEVHLEFYGNGFLYNMVRIMVGVVAEIGSGMRPESDVLRLFEVKDRDQARRTMPASGLYLKRVFYEGDDPEHPTKLPKR